MKKTKTSKKSFWKTEISFGQTPLTQKVFFAKHLNVMLKSGLLLSEALEALHDQATGRFKKVLFGVLSSITSGQSLANSLARYPKDFSNLFISIVRAGESSGTLEESLLNVSKQLEKERRLINKIKTIILYPIIIVSVAFITGIITSYFVLPEITASFKEFNTKLPIATRFLIWLSDSMQNYGPWILLGSILIMTLITWLYRQKFTQPIIGWFSLRLSVVRNISKESDLSRFCYTLSTLLKSGIGINEALIITKDTLSNYYYRKSIDSIAIQVTRGKKLTDALSNFKNLYSKITISMIGVGEKSGKLENTLFYLSDFYEEEIDNSIKALITVIEPVLLIIIGLIVAFLAFAVITPIYEVTGNINL